MPTPDRSPSILVADPSPKPHRSHQPSPPDPSSLWTGLFGLGVALSIIGWVDLGLLLWPPAFGRVEWEFGVITGFFDGLPVATMGMTLLVLGAEATGGRWLRHLTHILPALVCGVIIILAVFYALDVPVALKATPAEMKTVIYRSILKTGLFVVTYAGYYSWLAWFGWRCGRARQT